MPITPKTGSLFHADSQVAARKHAQAGTPVLNADIGLLPEA